MVYLCSNEGCGSKGSFGSCRENAKEYGDYSYRFAYVVRDLNLMYMVFSLGVIKISYVLKNWGSFRKTENEEMKIQNSNWINFEAKIEAFATKIHFVRS